MQVHLANGGEVFFCSVGKKEKKTNRESHGTMKSICQSVLLEINEFQSKLKIST